VDFYSSASKSKTTNTKIIILLTSNVAYLSRSQVQGIFDPVVQDVINLVQQQVRKIKLAGISIRAILLVGGFGGCEYLFRRLCKANPKITIMQPPDA
jgi:Mg2+/citrate symporter